MKYKQALKAIENCACAWVEGKVGLEVRDLTLAESIIARNQQAREREPLANSEIHGLKFEPPIGAQAAYAMERKLAFEANRFATEAVQ